MIISITQKKKKTKTKKKKEKKRNKKLYKVTLKKTPKHRAMQMFTYTYTQYTHNIITRFVRMNARYARCSPCGEHKR